MRPIGEELWPAEQNRVDLEAISEIGGYSP
jgi:hypothetical protein